MSCPLFCDTIQKCEEFFGEQITKLESIETCKSDNDYNECIFYKMLNQPKEKQCKFTSICKYVAVKTIFSLPLDEIKKQCNDFCLSENPEECAIYKCIDSVEEVPVGLLPDGRMIEVEELII